MGYYTTYRLYAMRNNAKLNSEEIEPILDKLYDISRYGYDELSYGEAVFYDIKWYDHDLDMITLSMLYPDIRFELEGDGEEDNDEWECTYVNGRYHDRDAEWDTGEIADFDPACLIPYNQVRTEFLQHLIPEMEDDIASEQVVNIL